MSIYHPPSFINAYLQEKIAISEGFATPMFPTTPTDMPTAGQGFTMSQLIGDDPTVTYRFGGAAAIYDRMFKMRRTPFPYIKCEQVLYYFYSMQEDAASKLIKITQRVQDLLDNGDDSAQDLNKWAAQKQASATPLVDEAGVKLLLPFFHSIKVFQLQETRDVVDFATARTFVGNKIVVDYDWHKS